MERVPGRFALLSCGGVSRSLCATIRTLRLRRKIKAALEDLG
jgi:hypothetical protein